MTARWRSIRRVLAGSPPVHNPFPGQQDRFLVAQTTVRAFYAIGLYFLVETILSETVKLAAHAPLDPLWPVAWLRFVNPGVGLRALAGASGIALLAAAILPGSRWSRVAGFLALLEFAALKNSYGKVGHSLHLMVWVAGVLILLPRGWTRPACKVNRRIRQETLLVFWIAQAVILLSYTMSGIGKAGGAIYQLARGEPNAFSPGGVGAHIAERLMQTHSESAFGAWIIAHPYLAWPAMPGAIVIELFAFLAAFRPALQRPYAAALILLHVGIYLAMTINFPQNCLLLALFFFQSPFEPEGITLAGRLAGLPFGQNALKLWAVVHRRLGSRREIDGAAGSL